jgi:hypothetical protein
MLYIEAVETRDTEGLTPLDYTKMATQCQRRFVAARHCITNTHN